MTDHAIEHKEREMTVKAVHTPGPWQAISTAAWSHVVTAHQYAVANEVHGGSPDERQANAKLIAAAPDLLAALREAITLLDEILPESDDIRIRCHAALAKAEA